MRRSDGVTAVLSGAVLRSAPSARVWATPTLLPASDDPTGCSDDRHRNNGAVLAPYELEPGRAWLAYSNVLAFFLESSASSQLKNGAPRCVVGAEGAKTCTSRLPGPVGARVARKAPPGRRSARNRRWYNNAALALAHVEPL